MHRSVLAPVLLHLARLRAASALGLALLLAACTAAPLDLGPGEDPHFGCSSTGEVCSCTDDIDCEADEICSADGFCDSAATAVVVACYSDDECGPGCWCDGGSCRPQPEPDDVGCTEDTDCADDEICNADGACTRTCLRAADCPAGWWCDTDRDVCVQ